MTPRVPYPLAGALLVAAALAFAADSACAPLVPDPASSAVVLESGGANLPVSLRCPRFVFQDLPAVGGAPPPEADGDLLSGEPIEVPFPPLALPDSGELEVRLLLQWSASESVLRKWARFRLIGAEAPRILTEVVLEDLDAAPYAVRLDPAWPQSHPAFLDGFFLGIEFPVAATRLEQGRLLLAHRPGLAVQPGVWYESRRAVYGLAPTGREQRAFRRYIAAHRPPPRGLHVNYNTWWTAPAPCGERDLLPLMQTFQDYLFSRRHARFDTFCIDMGWSNPQSIWEIDPARFPRGFTPIQQAAARMDSHLGLWISPCSAYPGALDNDWAAQAGCETFVVPWVENRPTRFLCLGGARYRQQFQDRLVDMITRFGLRHIKFDGYLFECPQADHGHQPGPLSAEPIAEGIIQVFRACRRAAPDIWLEPTCFGWNPSPWWLFTVNSLIGTYGDDAPFGRVPAPVHRESYTTARDFFNLQGACWLPVPIAAQEVLGLDHQTDEPFLNDAVITVMRGHMFLPLYLNPAFMDERRWNALADLLQWARANAPLLEDTEPLLPASWRGGACPRFTNDAVMPREPYGYAHWQRHRGLLALRNPWIVPRVFSLPLDLAPTAEALQAVSLYPEPRLYGENLRPGDTLQVPLAPYETVVLSIAPRQSTSGLAHASQQVLGKIEAAVSKRELARVDFQGDQEPFGPDYTCVLGEAASGAALHLQASLAIAAPQAELLVLLDGEDDAPPPSCRLRVNDQPVPVSSTGSASGWAASMLPKPERWLFLRAPLPSGRSDLDLELLAGAPSSTLSVWVWATRAGSPGAPHPDALPEPELLSLDAAPLLEPTDTAASLPIQRVPRPVERIDGRFLDTLQPVSASLGWGTLQRNRSVWDKPITIGGTRYLRGIGTHAPSRLVYALHGDYRRFQAWAGADQATSPTVTFEVRVDGRRRWESGLIGRDDPAQRVDLDVTGAQTLELLVGDGGNGITADHADWADARLLR